MIYSGRMNNINGFSGFDYLNRRSEQRLFRIYRKPNSFSKNLYAFMKLLKLILICLAPKFHSTIRSMHFTKQNFTKSWGSLKMKN